MIKTLFMIVASLALAVAPTTATYLTVTYDALNTVPAASTDWSSTIEYPQFDPSLGTLAGVYLSMSTNVTSAFSAYNPNVDLAQGSVETDFSINIGDIYTMATHVNSGNYYLAQYESYATAELYTLANGGKTTQNATQLAWFIGTGTVTLPATATSQLANIVYSGNVQYSSSLVTAAIYVSRVKYYYS